MVANMVDYNVMLLDFAEICSDSCTLPNIIACSNYTPANAQFQCIYLFLRSLLQYLIQPISWLHTLHQGVVAVFCRDVDKSTDGMIFCFVTQCNVLACDV